MIKGMVSLTQLRFGKELEQLKVSDIEFLIERRIDESQSLEYKEPTSNLEKDCDDLAKAISGFLNTEGGIIIYGVSEERENEHRYPENIMWCGAPKEQFESLLLNRVQPWEERIRIYRIPNEENDQKGIFVLEIPKSDNPPHMSNFSYYRRLNFRTEPMSHEDVMRAFQTSWMDRRELQQSVIQPLYSEIKENCGKLAKYETGLSVDYDRIAHANRYLYDRLESSLREKIAVFYVEMAKMNLLLTWKERIATKIINEVLCETFYQKRGEIRSNIRENLLQVVVRIRYLDGTINRVRHTLEDALFSEPDLRTCFQKKYSHAEILDYEPILAIPKQSDVKIPESTFGSLWQKSLRAAAENGVYSSIRSETPKLLALGEEILALMSTR